MTERHIEEHSKVQVYGGKQLFPYIHVQQVADQCRIPAYTIGEGIILEALFSKVEQERCGFDSQVESVWSGWRRPLVGCRGRDHMQQPEQCSDEEEGTRAPSVGVGLQHNGGRS